MYLGYRGQNLLFISSVECEGAPDVNVMEVDDSIDKSRLLTDYEIWQGKLIKKGDKKPTEQLRIAFVSVYKIKCGISTYAEKLFPQIYPHLKDYRIFSEYRQEEKALGQVLPDADNEKIIRCWQRGHPLGLLVQEINKFNPDIVYIEHEYGIFPDARHWISFISQLQKYKIYVKLHSVYKHKDKLICETIIPNIICHTNSAANVLRQKGVQSNIYTIIHGCSLHSTEKFWNLYKSQHTIIQFGFGFDYKGWETSLKAIAKLTSKFPDIFYTGLFSESPFSLQFHAHYFAKLESLVQELKIADHVGLIRGYHSDSALESFFRTNQLAVFPYKDNGEFTVYAASGAARCAMAAGLPTVLSKVPQFDDFEGICPRISNENTLASTIENLFLDKTLITKLVERQSAFLKENSWENIGKKHLKLFSESNV